MTRWTCAWLIQFGIGFSACKRGNGTDWKYDFCSLYSSKKFLACRLEDEAAVSVSFTWLFPVSRLEKKNYMEQIALDASYHELQLQLWVSRALVVFLKLKFPATRLKENKVSSHLAVGTGIIFTLPKQPFMHVSWLFWETWQSWWSVLSLHFWKPRAV